MTIHLSDVLLRDIHTHAERDYPHECCGVMVGSAKGDEKTVLSLVQATNVHEDGHERRYLISPNQLLEIDISARSKGETIVGIYHSHPNHPAIPSGYDQDWAWPWYSYIIVSVMDGKTANTTSWVLQDDRSKFDAEEIKIQA
ncbi:MAG: M67 family metallopeptidase [Chthonomonadales bacterium]